MDFTIVLTILEFIIAFGLLLFLHEFGHFLTARLFGVEVEEFGFGFPPRMVRLFTWKGTDFTLNWIPFGAFVRPKGENDPEVPGGLAAANPWKRLGVLVGGPMMNILTGILIFTILFTKTGAPDAKTVQIMEVADDSPAEQAGILPDDIVMKINGVEITSTTALSSIVKENLGKEVTLTLGRGEKIIEIKATPRLNPPPNQGSLGIVMGNPVKPISFFQAVPYALITAASQGAALVTMPILLIQGKVAAEDARMVGPVGMYDIYSQVRSRDVTAEAQPASTAADTLNRFWLLGIISIALGFTNLLPIPALDGGRILFVLPELLFRKRIPAQYENMIHLIGFAALLALMVYVTTQDITNRIVLP
ncbi:MAG: site-2 protease family protein [Leptolinea sp.]|jgi:regulator of sigma E protease|nr:site-2 protease family protein [Leptolinea sp.]